MKAQVQFTLLSQKSESKTEHGELFVIPGFFLVFMVSFKDQ